MWVFQNSPILKEKRKEFLCISLKDREHKTETEVDRESYIRTKAERDVYKKLYGDLLYTHLGR